MKKRQEVKAILINEVELIAHKVKNHFTLPIPVYSYNPVNRYINSLEKS